MFALRDVGRLLEPRPLPLEVGYERHENGVLHVACRTDMHGCTGEMFEWWFRSRPDTQQYIWWHPIDHVSSAWIEGTPDTHVGSIHLAEEALSGLPAQQLGIQFRPNDEFFDDDDYDAARGSRAISASVCGRVGAGHPPGLDEAGRAIGGRLLHIGRDTEWGLVMRSHFFLGTDFADLGMTPEQTAAIFPDEVGEALLMHAYNEFTYLSRFLPSVYLGDNRDDLEITPPW